MSEKQLLHLVFGGELDNPQELTFRDVEQLDLVGIYPNYAEAEKAWRKVSQANVDNAMMRYVIVHLHKLIHPDDPQDM